jgi:hypothetical protein
MPFAKQEREIEENFLFFLSAVPGLMDAHEGEFALLRQKQIVALYPTAAAAAAAGHDQFSDSIFSVQRVVDKPYDLGFLSNGSSNGAIV